MTNDTETAVLALRREATRLAGRPADLVQRASVYRHLFAHSGGNHVFPLLAAHGALWGSGYFRKGLRFGGLLASGLTALGADGEERRAQLQALAEAFREINRRVCVETWFIYHLTGRPALASQAGHLVPAGVRLAMERCHAARRVGRSLNAAERRDLFRTFFFWEQAEIVGPAVERAFDAFDWPALKALALRPHITFAYFARLPPLRFRDFSDTAERIDKGLAAFDRGAGQGWDAVEAALDAYGIMPPEFRVDPVAHYMSLQSATINGYLLAA